MRNVVVIGSVTSFIAVLAAACGGAAPPSAATSPAEKVELAPTPEPATVEEAQRQIKDAKGALDGANPRSASESTKTAEASATKSETNGEAGDGSVNRCVSPCRAIASMRRAVGALCRMAGDTDMRCTDAKKTLEESEGRVATCRC